MRNSTQGETWEDVEQARETPAPRHPHLFVVLECDRPCSGGARYSLADVREMTIGRGAERGPERAGGSEAHRLVVRVPGRWLSSTHARILRVGETDWAVEDAGSKNGTFLNGLAIQRAPLTDGDVLEAGHTLFVFRAGLPTPPTTPLDVDVSAGESAGNTLVPQGMHKLEELRRIARSEVPVLLLGETGSGKEVLARAVHERSGRAGAFVGVNCGALSASLLEGLLFGHVRGAFSGAVRDEPGLVRAADGGTLFLDEIGDLAPGAQAALLRVLQEREVVPVGGVRPVKVDVRVVAATHRPLEELSQRGEFRNDLFARLNGFLHRVPPLRDRREDLGILTGTLLGRALGAQASSATLSVAAGRALLAHRWPSNVRELAQCLARAIALAPNGSIEASHLPEGITAPSPGTNDAPRASLRLSDADIQLRAQLVAELRKRGGNVSEVARAMGKARMQIQRWLKRLQIDAKEYRDPEG
jgi:transcriptional regulator with AAA-type ATPase domain